MSWWYWIWTGNHRYTFTQLNFDLQPSIVSKQIQTKVFPLISTQANARRKLTKQFDIQKKWTIKHINVSHGKSDRIWSNLMKSDQFWSNLINFDQIWSKMVFDQNWSNLIRIDQICNFLVFCFFENKFIVLCCFETKSNCLFCALTNV